MTNARNKFQSSGSTNLGHPSKWMQQVVKLLLCMTKTYIHHHHLLLLLHHHHHHHHHHHLHHHHLAKQTHLNIMPAPLCQKTPASTTRRVAHVSDNVKGHVANHIDVAGAVHRHGLVFCCSWKNSWRPGWSINYHLEDGSLPRLGSVVRMGLPPYITAIKRSFKEGVPQPQEWGTEN